MQTITRTDTRLVNDRPAARTPRVDTRLRAIVWRALIVYMLIMVGIIIIWGGVSLISTLMS